MISRTGRTLLLAGGMALVFAVVVVLLLRIIPGPHRQTDYLVIGTLATFASLATLFVVLAGSFLKDPSVFFKRKKG
jgi:hypothetical protein